MARTLSDTLIIAVVEAATRLTGARGPIAGSAAANAQSAAAATPPAGEGAATGATTAAAAPAPSRGGEGAPSGGEHDTRTAEQIASDFKAIYAQIEEVVRASAEQETKAVGFSPR